MLKATPISCKRSATSSILIDYHPSLTGFTLGKCVLSITAFVKRIIKSTSLKLQHQPLQTTFFYGQPKLISIISGFTAETIFEEIAIASSSPPKFDTYRALRNRKYLISFGF
jgi:hypothetical protein